MRAIPGWRPASRPSGAVQRGLLSTARQTHDIRGPHIERRHCDAAPSRSSPGLDDRPCDLAHALALNPQERDLLPLREGQVAARRSEFQIKRWHPASVVEPPLRDRRRHTDDPGRLNGDKPLGDLDPKRGHDGSLELRMTRRPQPRAHRAICCLLTTNHHTPPNRGVATTS
jgi:hypothetical protein